MIEGMDETLIKCYNSTKVFARTVFPEDFFREFSSKHDEWFEVIDDDSIKYVVVTMFRGGGKTTTMKAKCIKNIVFDDSKFIMPLGATYTHAEKQSEDIKKRLTQNLIIRDLFGDLRSKDDFTKEGWQTVRTTDSGLVVDGTYVMPRGSGQQMRGHIAGRYRPDLFWVDDLEKPEYVQSDEQRLKTKEWFFADVLNAVDKGLGGPNWRIIVTGTILHEDSLLVDLINDPKWVHVDFPLCDNKFKSYWPGYASDEMVAEEIEDHRRRHMMDIFYRERMNLPIADETRAFRDEYFKRYISNKDILQTHPDIETFVIIDPAKTTNITSDYTAIVGGGVSFSAGKLFFMDVREGHYTPEQIYEETFNMMNRLHTNVLGVEVTSLHQFITYPIKNYFMRRNRPLDYIELNAVGKKPQRIRELVPFYQQGCVYHLDSIAGTIETQLASFPRSKRWDVMDAWAYCIKLFEETGRYFDPVFEKGKDEFSSIPSDDYPDEPLEQYDVIDILGSNLNEEFGGGYGDSWKHVGRYAGLA